MTSASIARSGLLPSRGSASLQLAVIAAITVLADWLLYGFTDCISIVLFIIAIAVGVVVTNPVRAPRREMLAAVGILIAALLPSIAGRSPLTLGFATAGIVYFALIAAAGLSGGVAHRVAEAALLIVTGPFRIYRDLGRARECLTRDDWSTRAADVAAAWAVPVMLGAVFVALLTLANPVIEGWLAALDFRGGASHIEAARVMFWLLMIAISWPLICVGRHGIGQDWSVMQPEDYVPPAIPGRLFDQAVILRSLVLFNLLFAVQTVLDIDYLWGGAALPQGMTYATYAHRGAYPLIVTALLAAAFVVAAMRPGGAAERSPLIRGLVFLWIGQNVLLVGSSIFRLDLYVNTYSLTYLRVVAFIWMMLVAVGLVLIVARIVLRRSNAWLIGVNSAALALTLYACCFVNFPDVVATFNVLHSRDIGGRGEPLDVGYLVSLGPQVIPALDLYVARREAQPSFYAGHEARLFRETLATSHRIEMRNWRAWNFRGARLLNYLDHPGSSTN